MSVMGSAGVRPEVLVIGAGLVGAACAAELAAAGLEVLVLEAAHPGGGTTAAGMGHVVAMDDSPAQLALCRYSQLLWAELADQLPARVENDPCGTVWVAADGEELAAVYAKQAVYAAAEIPSEALDAKALYQAEPNLRPGLAGGLLLPQDSVLYPPAAVDFLLARARDAADRHRRPFSVLPGMRVREIVARPGGAAVVLEDGSRLEASWVVSAAGLDAIELLSPALAEQVPGAAIRPRKGHLVITDRYPGFCHHQLVELGYLKSAHGSTSDSVAFNLQPRATGQMLVGSSRQYGAVDTAVDPPMVAKMLERALEYLPALAHLAVSRVWAGLRPASADKTPLIGPLPGTPEVLLAAGHEGLGITTSLATGRLIADAICQRGSAIAPDPYRPGRFLEAM